MSEAFADLRERDKVTILSCLKRNLSSVVYGSNGIGKTQLIKSVVEEVNDSLGQAVYIDCSLYRTTNAVLREILLSIGSVIASKSNYELTKRLKEKTKKSKVFVFLDHFDDIKNDDAPGILLGLDFCVCIVADCLDSYKKIDLGIRTKIANAIRLERPTPCQVVE